MLYFSKWKIQAILLVCFLGIAYSVPNLLSREQAESLPTWLPHQRVNLGLDLRGGSHILLEVDVRAVVRERLENLVESVRRTLLDQRIGYTGGINIVEDRVVVRLRQVDQLPLAMENLRKLAAPVTSSLLGQSGTLDIQVQSQLDGQITLSYTEAAIQQKVTNAVQQSIEIVRRRIDETGVNEPTIQRQGADRILVQLPGLDDPERVKRLLGQTAKLTFRMVDTSPEAAAGQVPPGSERLPADDEVGADGRPREYIVRKRVEVAGDNLVDAQPNFDQRTAQPIVNFRFDAVGGRRFAETTRNNVGRPFAIVLDNKVISAPVIREPILGGSGQISGNFTVESANDLAVLLRAGALPAPLRIIEERTVGPDLGADSIRAGVIASVLGFVLVIIFMIASYGLFGIFANIALVMNLFLLMAALSVLQATLTLPGIAGIVLTMGMSVDANVLIFERIKEEFRGGKSVMNAVEAGFRRAFTTIVDSNLTTILTAAILFAFGSGPVRGFAVTLSIGIVISMFTAILVCRLMIVTWLRRARPKTLVI
ncbi:MAG: protein translocase subunit SecD [Alphaproteobacteria bacterium]|nr:protein translocase subunit SecD [Alphaproteobacteria bacterium]